MPRILVSPLDWGLGHATRCVPIIRYLKEKGAEVIIGADGRPLELLKKEFPRLDFVRMPGYRVRYRKNWPATVSIAMSVRNILTGIRKENLQLQQLIKEKKLDAVISDNRYGLYSVSIPSVFITHQIAIRSPLAENILYSMNISRIRNFSECWIPDLPGEPNLTGSLSHGKDLPDLCTFIGPLSRFSGKRSADVSKGSVKYLFIVSGPEDQRTHFENFLRRLIGDLIQNEMPQGSIVLVRGVSEGPVVKKTNGPITEYSHLPADELGDLIAGSDLVIARSGYSTIMDLAALGKKTILIPTPGQTEQEYLADKFSKERIAYSASQNKFDLQKALRESSDYSGFDKEKYSSVNFREVVDNWLARI